MWNSGFSFGLGNGLLPAYFYVLIVGMLLVLIITKVVIGWGWWLILTGGGMNSISRLLNGSVRDDLHWNWGFSLWFNWADVVIVSGVVLVLYDVLKTNAKS